MPGGSRRAAAKLPTQLLFEGTADQQRLVHRFDQAIPPPHQARQRKAAPVASGFLFGEDPGRSQTGQRAQADTGIGVAGVQRCVPIVGYVETLRRGDRHTAYCKLGPARLMCEDGVGQQVLLAASGQHSERRIGNA